MRSIQHFTRRGRRYPVAAPAGSVGLAGRLRCDARATRAAAMPLAAALNAPPLHGFSPVRRLRRRTSPCAAALLAAPQVAATGYRPPRSTTEVFVDKDRSGARKAVGGCASAATLCGAEERRARGRARAARASTSDSRRLFEHSERSERSEFRRGPRERAPEGIRSEAEDAAHERRRIPACGFASLQSVAAHERCTSHPVEPAAAPRPAARRHRLDRGDRRRAGDHRRHSDAQPRGARRQRVPRQ